MAARYMAQQTEHNVKLIPLFVCGLNLGRRHMSTEEKAVAAFKALPMYEAEAKERQRAAGGDRKSDEYQKSDVPTLEQAIPEPKSIERAASAFGVGKQYIADIKRIEREAPEVFKNFPKV